MALYDPKEFPNEIETTTDFTLAEILAWARAKPADEAYNYHDAEVCAVAQFGLATGRTYLVNLDACELAEKSTSLEQAAVSRPHTFGAFADRLEQALVR